MAPHDGRFTPRRRSRRRCHENNTRRHARRAAVTSCGRRLRASRTGIGNVNTHCRYGTRGSTWSTRWAAVSSARRAVQEGQMPRRHSWLSSRAEACAPLPSGYRPRDVENVPWHRAVRHHRAAFAGVVARRSQMMPKLVERELDGYVGCGVLARGFARVRRGACGHELLVPFSCKRRGNGP
jgi:hypothetical protein